MTHSLDFATHLLQDGGGITSMLVPIAIMFAIFYFLLIRPQSKERRQQQEMRNDLKKGDKILTQGGIVAKVQQVKEGEVIIDLEGSARMRIVKESVIRVLSNGKRDGKGTSTDDKAKSEATEKGEKAEKA
ncbi:MAG: preprotein translocase subunit YajC [Planctomycetes bacterium]|nr:preprotein translocase subunit YajC [Planctomycetota bacterium]